MSCVENTLTLKLFYEISLKGTELFRESIEYDLHSMQHKISLYRCNAFVYDFVAKLLILIMVDEHADLEFTKQSFMVSALCCNNDERLNCLQLYASAPRKNFLYMAQTDNNTKISVQQTDDRDLIILNFKHECANSIYLPKSTWTEGRNNLREFALSLPYHYQYYVLMDDDVVFERGSIELTERDLLANGYAIFAPRMANYLYDCRGRNANHNVFCAYYFDPIMNYFSVSAFLDKNLFPYDCSMDSKSWWFSGGTLIAMCAKYYKGQVVISNRNTILNMEHREYPRNIQISTFLDQVGINAQIDEPALDIYSDNLNTTFRCPD